MATASALEGLGPMQRRDSKVGTMIKMFKSPDTHAKFLTSSRFAHDLIAVGPWRWSICLRRLAAVSPADNCYNVLCLTAPCRLFETMVGDHCVRYKYNEP